MGVTKPHRWLHDGVVAHTFGRFGDEWEDIVTSCGMTMKGAAWLFSLPRAEDFKLKTWSKPCEACFVAREAK